MIKPQCSNGYATVVLPYASVKQRVTFFWVWVALGLAGEAWAGRVCSVRSGILPIPFTDYDGGEQISRVPLAPVDSSRAIVWAAANGGNGSLAGYQFHVQLFGGADAGIVFRRETGSGDTAVTWQVAEFCPDAGVNVQRGVEENMTNSTVIGTPLTFDPSHALVVASFRGPSYNAGPNTFAIAYPTSNSTIRFQHGFNATNVAAAWQLWEDDGMRVSRWGGQMVVGVNDAFVAATPTSDPAFARVTWRTTEGYTAGTANLTARLVDGGIQVQRQNSTDSTIDFEVEQVSFLDGTRVLSGRELFTDTDIRKTVSLSAPVDPSRSVAFTAGAEMWGMSANSTIDAIVVARVAGSTSLDLERTRSDPVTVDWVVLEFPPPGAGQTDGGTGPGFDAGMCINSVPHPDGGCYVPVPPEKLQVGCPGCSAGNFGAGLTALLLLSLRRAKGQRRRRS